MPTGELYVYLDTILIYGDFKSSSLDFTCVSSMMSYRGKGGSKSLVYMVEFLYGNLWFPN